MQILAVGFALPNPSIDNYNPLTAPSYFDYDAVIIDPESVTRFPRELMDEGKTFDAHDGRPVVNGASTASSVSIADQLKRRTEEATRLLDSGGTVIVFGRPNSTISGIVGFEGADRYHWLPAPEGASWGPPLLRAAEGKTVRIKDDVHPIADVLREYRKQTVYRAVFDDRHPMVRNGGRILAAGGADVPIAVQFDVLAGRVLFIPAMQIASGDTRGKLAAAMVDVVRRISGETVETAAPTWARALAIPGLEQLEAEAEEATQAESAARSHLADVKERLDALTRFRALVWAEGSQFEMALRASLEALGFAVTSAAGSPLTISADGETIYVEAESSRSAVVEWPYIRLQRRLEEELLKRGKTPRGLVVANGLRGEAPDQRKKQYTDALSNASENYRYGLVTAETLFALTQRALGGAEAEELEGMRRRILRARGPLTLAAALGEGEESDTGTIF